FPLAIFSGQILAALAAGNAVIAKPAEQTPLIAQRAIELMHEAGIPKSAVQLLPGPGHRVGAALTQDPRIDGVCFTGSTPTAQHIHRSIAQALTPDAPLIAETGGLNAMIVDSTALPEQVVRDVVQSAFQSAGQRCSALRMLYVQEDIAESLLTMLYGAMDELQLGDPWLHNTDIGPVIDAAAKARIDAHCADFAARGKLLKHVPIPAHGTFVAPTVLQVDGIAELQEEIFGPVLHVATFAAAELDTVVNDINAKGYGLTFGLHTRMDSRVEHIVHRMRVGNIYVNRNQIGAVVGSQPFGGEGLSGTGPKAGGPQYVQRFTRSQTHAAIAATAAPQVSPETLQAAIDTLAASTVPDDEYQAQLRALFARAPFTPPKPPADAETMPGPTGEMNLLSQCSRGRILCLGPDLASASHQAAIALSQGNAALVIAPGIEAWLSQHDPQDLPITGIDGQPDPASLTTLTGFAAVCSSAKDTQLRAIRQALAARDGALLPLITALDEVEQFVLERHLCIDTTAAGGNASLIAATE
ncbi:MAG TPA: delta-1-pyrroline-5-carboxylate dehydrogenase, partial [Gammaproteobacteria bacterium]|nr:delta-1-pyrroline-5-carboxylate dehydrogenase [Gammaproteobacteria bacterium]